MTKKDTFVSDSITTAWGKAVGKWRHLKGSKKAEWEVKTLRNAYFSYLFWNDLNIWEATK